MSYKIEIGKKIYSFDDSVKLLTKMLKGKKGTWNKITLIADKPKNCYLLLFQNPKKDLVIITPHLLIPDGNFYELKPNNDYHTNEVGAIEYYTNFYKGLENE